MKITSSITQEMPWDIVGSTAYGISSKISAEATYNMIISDGFLVSLPGYKKVVDFPGCQQGRGNFYSVKLNKLINVIDNKVFLVSKYSSSNVVYSQIGLINSFTGGISIDENDGGQIAICDGFSIYIYDYNKDLFAKTTLPTGFIPGYVIYHGGYFVAIDTASNLWGLSAQNDGLNWLWGDSGQPVLGALQSKPDKGVAVLRAPGQNDMIYVMGQTVIEFWKLTGQGLFPYSRVGSINIDYGVINSDSLSSLDTFTAWVGKNEKSKAAIYYLDGTELKKFPNTDGINHVIEQLKHPDKCCGFFMSLHGHSIYQVTWYDEEDNLSFLLDFTSLKFYTCTRENNNFHPARRVAIYDNEYYFVSLIDGGLYNINQNLYTYDYGYFKNGSSKIYQIPRIRISKTIRLKNFERFRGNYAEFLLEQGTDPMAHGDITYRPKVLLSLSRDGGKTFGNDVAYTLNTIGHRQNRINWFGLGAQNELTPQIRFYNFHNVVAGNGTIGVSR